jgi:hypothetical protein
LGSWITKIGCPSRNSMKVWRSSSKKARQSSR